MKIKSFLDKYVSTFSRIAILAALASGIILAMSKAFPLFADWFNRYISSFCRLVVSKITGILPFSLGEALFLCLPLFAFVALFLYFKVFYNDDIKSGRFVVALASCLCMLFTSFVFMFGTAYNGTPLSHKLGLSQDPVSYEELEHTANCLIDEIDSVIDEIDYKYDGLSRMPYSFGELNSKLNDAYASFSSEHRFVPKLRSDVKILAVSPVMTYTHISGVFTYYTGEANLNVNYPDYSMPYTMAHEMAHQRGVAPENEANFVAFLVCMESDDPYIRYSAAMSMLEYLMNAMYSASPDEYSDFTSDMDLRIKGEMYGFSRFFEKYRESVASDVTEVVNDTYLKANGAKAGTQSYGMVVDLACAYYKD
ncbi:MAG: DUF3810 domain-containing protein [Clostridia bacterium]|nr:DUF3810 domain-containing protein [Clostridia bacterium]